MRQQLLKRGYVGENIPESGIIPSSNEIVKWEEIIPEDLEVVTSNTSKLGSNTLNVTSR